MVVFKLALFSSIDAEFREDKVCSESENSRIAIGIAVETMEEDTHYFVLCD